MRARADLGLKSARADVAVLEGAALNLKAALAGIIRARAALSLKAALIYVIAVRAV